MDREKARNRKNRVLMGIYSSSWGTSMIALIIVAILEICMLVFSFVDTALYESYLWRYRIFYISLLTVALVYIALNLYVKRDIGRRHVWLNVANPVCAVFFFAWALGITYFDAVKFGLVDPTVFMTFSLTVPLSFYLFPSVYAVVVVAANVIMMYLTARFAGSIAPLINISIFFIFQLVLGVSFLRLKVRLAERIVEEQENADIDVMTGFPNRRVYAEDMKKLMDGPVPDDLVYIAIDMNELKKVNDSRGHEAGDRLIVGAAQCIEACFGDRGKMYRIGGDEFVVLAHLDGDDLARRLGDYERCMKSWSGQNGLSLSSSYGCARHDEYPDGSIAELAKAADTRMYEAKARYYQRSGRDRRHYMRGDCEPRQ